MKAALFSIAQTDGGALLIGPRPPSRSLEQWCAQLAARQIDQVISLLSDAEVATFDLGDEETLLNGLGIGFTRFPVEDFGIPDPEAFRHLVSDICAQLRGGKTVLAHCAAGVGRSGTVAACVITAFGRDAEKAMVEVSAARGMVSPETSAQRDFVRSFGLATGVTLA
ncbi:MAG: tyrosine-protein phosphatase [Ahrensia sp.]|nr:tyrosine-protein phosphatase [Ahrensia sp.]